MPKSRADAPRTDFASLGLSDPLVAAVTALGYEEPTPVQRETIPLLLERPRRGRSGRHRHRQDRRLRAPTAAAHHRGGSGTRPDQRLHPGSHPRAGDAGGRGGPQVREGPRPERRAAVWRCGHGSADPRPEARRRRRGGDSRSSPGSPPTAGAEARRGSHADPRRGGRDARHGIRRRPRGDPERDGVRSADGALHGHHASAHRRHRRTAPASARARDHGA